ncbi:MAG: TIGR04211 family SH3 domain-containing protein [Halomonadaceae bacterium]|nr:MAG: TIGR04211 family SH3 domain-containing protein [Halomonadaceae bacterium]
MPDTSRNTIVKVFPLITVLLTSLLLAGSLQASTRYIDDTLYAPVRTGESNQYRIIHSGLRSGTRVEVLSDNEESGYSRIRFGDDREGFIETRYLRSSPIAADRLATSNANLEQAQQNLRSLRSEKSDLEEAVAALESRNSLLEEELATVSSELERISSISEDALRLDTRNTELREENQSLKNEAELLATENQRLRDRRESSFMLIGGGLVIGGILITILFPLLKPARKSDNWA